MITNKRTYPPFYITQQNRSRKIRGLNLITIMKLKTYKTIKIDSLPKA